MDIIYKFNKVTFWIFLEYRVADLIGLNSNLLIDGQNHGPSVKKSQLDMHSTSDTQKIICHTGVSFGKQGVPLPVLSLLTGQPSLPPGSEQGWPAHDLRMELPLKSP